MNKLNKTTTNRLVTILSPIAEDEKLTVFVKNNKLTIVNGWETHPELKEVSDYEFCWMGIKPVPATKEQVLGFLQQSMKCQDITRNAVHEVEVC